VGKEVALRFKSAVCGRVVVRVVGIHGQVELLRFRYLPVPDVCQLSLQVNAVDSLLNGVNLGY
jgi:hypothetical protein